MSQSSTVLRFVAEPKLREFAPLLPIRIADASDQRKIAELMIEAYKFSALPRTLSLEQSQSTVRNFFAKMIFREASYVCGPADKVVSVLLVARPKDPRSLPRIYEVFTHPQYRSRGFASSLITQCLNTLSKLSQSGLEVIVEPKNEPMIRILRKLGFAESQVPQSG